jgi:D-alanyl-D-alanine carboxypeptidase (penicillin-binding protein 5/6)
LAFGFSFNEGAAVDMATRSPKAPEQKRAKATDFDSRRGSKWPSSERMTLRRLFFAFAACLAAASGTAAPRPPAYKGAVVMDADTGRILFEDGADEVSPPASMTKLMTFAVLDDRIRAGALSLQTSVTVVAADTKASPSIIGLKPREVFPMEELVYAMMLPSANDAALAVARVVGGSVPAFVDLMNAKARALGMTHTRFRTPNGLPVPSHRIADGDLTSPRDFALLCRYLLVHTDILKYTSVKTRPFGSGFRFPPTIMTNHNHLLGKIVGVDGLKTGFTNGAGFCLAATARRNGHRIIVVMMDCPDHISRDLRVADLIERGFATPRLAIPQLSPTVPKRPEGEAQPAIQFSVPR